MLSGAQIAGLSTVVEANKGWGAWRQWLRQWYDQWVISLSVQEICSSCRCIQGLPRVTGCFKIMLTRNDMCSSCKCTDLEEEGLTAEYDPMGLILWAYPIDSMDVYRGCCKDCVGICNLFTVAWLMKLPADPKSISTDRIKKVWVFLYFQGEWLVRQ